MRRSTKFYMLVILVFVSLLGAQAVFAGDVSAEGDHPALDTNANACMAGGSLEGKCDSEAMWNAGWYLVRFERGEIDHDEFPDDYAWVLPGHDGDDTHDDGSDHEDEICLEEVEVHEG